VEEIAFDTKVLGFKRDDFENTPETMKKRESSG
jgi:hypothetical protein